MTLSEELTWRGFVNQTTFSKIEDINEPRTFYWGVDPSADSMTIGHLAPAMMIRHFINHGHTPILLVGGATGMIGDPDGKKQERDLKTVDEINRNKDALIRQYESLFNGIQFETVDNYDWFKGIHFLDFLRDIGKHVSMTQMLDRDFIKSRVGEGGSGISYAEFSYSLIQGYDFLHLFRSKGATMQVAGADQWGNSVTGVQLIRRLEGSESHVFTTPLIINKTTGMKFGKSEAGAIWLDPHKTSPYQFYQFWLNVDDNTARDLLKIYTMLDKDTIMSLYGKHDEDPSQRVLQKALAHEVTEIVHGAARRDAVKNITDVLFGAMTFDQLGPDGISELSQEIKSFERGVTSDLLVQSGFAKSAGEARRLIEAGAISINGQKISSDQLITDVSLVKKGKNSYFLTK